LTDSVLQSASDLNLPVKAGYGLWSKTQPVPDGKWTEAEDVLVRAAQEWMTEPTNATPTGCRLNRSDTTKRLTLSLMR